jgi:xylan 1,4-beta-xylosidase
MGAPQEPTPEQYADLESAGQLTAIGSDKTIRVIGGRASIAFDLPRQAVSLLVITAGPHIRAVPQ